MQEQTQELINKLGSDTIMGTMSQGLTEEMKNNMEKLSQAVEESKDLYDQNAERPVELDEVTLNKLAQAGYFRKTRPVERDNPKIGRNDLCPCGSGKKYKNCCMNSGKYETTHYR